MYLIPCEVQATPEILNIIFILASVYFAKFCTLPSEYLAINSDKYNGNNDTSPGGLSCEKSFLHPDFNHPMTSVSTWENMTDEFLTFMMWRRNTGLEPSVVSAKKERESELKKEDTMERKGLERLS